MQHGARSLDGLSPYFAFFGYANYTLTGHGDAERLIGVPVGPGFFELLGVTPMRGRTFTTEELKPNGPGAVLLTHALWQRTFGADPNVVGRTITGERHADDRGRRAPGDVRFLLDLHARGAGGHVRPRGL